MDGISAMKLNFFVTFMKRFVHLLYSILTPFTSALYCSCNLFVT